MTQLRPGDIRNVAVFRALFLGDLLCSVPALRSLRKGLPQARITFIGLPWASEFARRFETYLDGFIEFPGHPALDSKTFSARQFIDFLDAAQKKNFDLAIQLHGAGPQTNFLIAMLGAKQNAGHFIPGQFCPDGSLFRPYDSAEHEIWRNISLMTFLGLPFLGEELEFPLIERDFEALEPFGLKRDYIVVHPGAKSPERRWPIENFARAADHFAKLGYTIVITGGLDEYQLAERMARLMIEPARLLAGRTGLGTLGALIRKARLVICNDTGISHVAAATKTPSVITLTRPEALSWPPLNRRLHTTAYAPGGAPLSEVIRLGTDLLENNSDFTTRGRKRRNHVASENSDMARTRKLPLLSHESPP